MRRRLTGALVALAVVVAPVGVANAASFNVKDYGAKGDGKAIDSVAIDKAIAAASAANGGIVEIPPGTYLSRSIHLKSNVTINIQQGARIVASGSGIDAPEPNPTYRKYQDFGHSHFRNALLWGENVENINFTGKGVIDGANKLETGENIPAGKGDKMLSLKFCKNVNITDVTFREAGHFAIIVNGCNGMKLDRIVVDSPDDRDGINFINSSNVELSNSTDRLQRRRGGVQERLRDRQDVPEREQHRPRLDDPVDREQRHPVRLGDLRQLQEHPVPQPQGHRRLEGGPRHGVDGRRDHRGRRSTTTSS